MFADAVYEVTAIIDSKILEWDGHIKRLQRSLNEKEGRREELQRSIAESSSQLGDLKSKISAQRVKENEAQVREQRIQSELAGLDDLLALEEQNISKSRANLEKALDVMADDAGVREKLEHDRELNQENLSDAREKVKKYKDLSHELELRQQSTSLIEADADYKLKSSGLLRFQAHLHHHLSQDSAALQQPAQTPISFLMETQHRRGHEDHFD